MIVRLPLKRGMSRMETKSRENILQCTGRGAKKYTGSINTRTANFLTIPVHGRGVTDVTYPFQRGSDEGALFKKNKD